MARKLRIEYRGAMYHVINRGNYREDIFATDGAKRAFEACLWEACAKTRWRLHAYQVMRNHYHLALETPEANLVEGMWWLQSTYANRFNRFRRENGHVFQGRYRALVVEDLEHLGAVGHYIHLNPVRAGLCPVAQLKERRFGSSYYLTRPRQRPACLTFEAVLRSAGGLPDTKEGWQSHWDYLEWLAEDQPAQQKLAFDRMCRGWALGSPEFKTALLKEHEDALEAAPAETETQAEVRHLRWKAALNEALQAIGRGNAEVLTDGLSAPWKVAVAVHLRRTTTASNGWLAKELRMGSASAVSRYVSEWRGGWRPEAQQILARMARRGLARSREMPGRGRWFR